MAGHAGVDESLNRADAILLKCLGSWGDETAAASLSGLNPAEWAELVREAAVRQVAALLFLRLKALADVVTIPEAVGVLLKEYYQISAAKNIRLGRELISLLSRLNQLGHEVVLLKGAHLAWGIYPDSAVRPMDDLDLLVRSGEMLAIREQLAGMRPEARMGKFKVDLHGNIESASSPFNIDLDGLWERAFPITLFGCRALVLSPEDALLHQCLHNFYRHLYAPVGIRGFCDTAAIMLRFREELDWSVIRQRAEAWNAWNCLMLGLQLTAELMNVRPEGSGADAIKAGRVNPLLGSLARSQFLQFRLRPALPSPYFIRFLNAGSVRRRLKIALQSAFPSREFVSGKFGVKPGSLKYFYFYCFRLWRVIIISGRTIVQLVTGGAEIRRLTGLNRWLSRGK